MQFVRQARQGSSYQCDEGVIVTNKVSPSATETTPSFSSQFKLETYIIIVYYRMNVIKDITKLMCLKAIFYYVHESMIMYLVLLVE